jgi:hypothetical protein
MDQAVAKPMQRALAAAPRTLDQLAVKRAEMAEIQSGMAAIRAALDRQLAAANAAREALKQPSDLEPVYDAAYERDVTQPAKAFAEIFPDLDAALGSIVALADYLDRHKDRISIDGGAIRLADPSLQPELEKLVDALRARQHAMQSAQRRLNELVRGGG